jgi:hypothetical protein
MSEQKGIFPIWSLNQIENLEKLGHKKPQCLVPQCKHCHELKSLQILKWWYEEVFISSSLSSSPYDTTTTKTSSDSTTTTTNTQDIFIKSDMSKILKTNRRLKGLVIRSAREVGKTSWFLSICQGDTSRIAHFKNKFTTGQEINKLKNQTAWLILCDDMSKLNEEDKQCLKALFVGEATTITGKKY